MNRKEEIIYATLELASVNGIKGVTMAQIADKVGIKPGYLYHTIDSLHAYQKDWWMLKTSIEDIK